MIRYTQQLKIYIVLYHMQNVDIMSGKIVVKQ